MRGAKIYSAFLLAVLVSSFALAAFKYDGNQLSSSYIAGQQITGKVNLTFTDHEADSVLTSNFNGNITLAEFLKKNNANFTCSPSDCLDGYSDFGSPINEININDESVVGFKLSGPEVFVTDAEVSFGGSSGPSCTNQMIVDFLDDGENLLINPAYQNESCFSKKYGCFDTGLASYELATISTQLYCNNVTLEAAPAYQVGAKLHNKNTGSGGVEMQLLSKELNFLGKCTLPNINQSVQEASCVIEYSGTKPDNYFVCVRAEESSSNYRINSETMGGICGVANPFSTTLGTTDFEIYASPLKFADVNLKAKELFNKAHNLDLAGYIDSYVSEKYGRDCTEGCIIPIKVSGQNQKVTFSGAAITYSRAGVSIQTNQIFMLTKEGAKVNSGNLTLELEHAGFTIPIGSKSKVFTLYVDGSKVFSEPINIMPSFDFEISPKFVSFGQTTKFTALTQFNITNSVWDFGDGTGEKTSNGKEINHAYLEQGTFDAEVKITRVDGTIASKKFKIVVGEAKGAVNETITEYKKRISDIENDISTFPSWAQLKIKEVIDVEAMKAALSEEEEKYNSASNDSDYESIMLALVELDVPASIEETKVSTFPLVAGYETFNPSYIQAASSSQINDFTELRNLISSWMVENVDAEARVSVVAATGDSGAEDLMTLFKVETKPKKSITEKVFLVIGLNPQAIAFRSSYGESSAGGGTIIELAPSSNQVFEFAITGEVSALDAGIYISPLVENLGGAVQVVSCNFDDRCDKSRGENRDNCADCRPWGWFSIWMILLLLAAFAGYVALQEWYKKRYESSLFPDKNDLYNLLNFIYNSRRSGLDDKTLRGKLAEAGWRGEKINYAMRKIDGKRTGMYEVPIFKFLENRRVRMELEKRQKERIDARFIKR